LDDSLDPQRLFGAAACGRLVGADGEVLEVVESTMDTARRLALGGAPDGYAVLAERQRSGRGRTGSWECPPKEGLLLSVILRLGLPAAERKLFALTGAVAAAEALQQFCPAVQIKWPNDLVVAQDGEMLSVRKLGGVLVEQCGEGDAAPVHVLGIGVNVNQDRRRLPEQVPIPASSLKIELGGETLDRNEICLHLLEKLDFWYGKLRLGYQEAVLARWRTLSCLLGRQIRAQVEGSVLSGEVIGVRASGELILQRGDGRQALLSSEKTSLLLGSGPQEP